MKIIGIVGAGQMGGGIAQVAAQAGYEVLLNDINQERADQGLAAIKKQLERLVSKEKITSDACSSAYEKICSTAKLEDLSKADFIIEAASENIELKFELFRKLDSLAKPGVILASNTSSISITTIAAQTKRPEAVVGMHFMNPVPVMKLVEGIRGLRTSDETFTTMRTLTEKLGKTLVESKDYPGFIINRILMPMINEAVYALYEGLATVTDIDTGMKLGTNQPMGPLTLADFIGLDTCLAIMNVLYDGLGDSKYRPCPLLKQYVDAGLLGRKTKIGFYDYRQTEPVVTDTRNI